MSGFEKKAIEYGFKYENERYAEGEFSDVCIITNKAAVKIGEWLVLDYEDAVRMAKELERAVDFVHDMNEILGGEQVC